MTSSRRPTPYALELLVSIRRYLRGALTIEEYRREVAVINVRHGKAQTAEVQAPGDTALVITVRRGAEAS